MSSSRFFSFTRYVAQTGLPFVDVVCCSLCLCVVSLLELWLTAQKQLRVCDDWNREVLSLLRITLRKPRCIYQVGFTAIS